MILTPSEVQKKFDVIQKEYQDWEVKKSKCQESVLVAQEEVLKCSLQQQKLSTELNELLVLVNTQKAGLGGLSLPGDMKLKKGSPVN
jgi:hypothetical protein